MSTITFDTGLAVESLQQNGFDLPQARGIVEVIKTAQTELATKHDIDLLHKEIELLRRDLTVRMLLIVGAATAFNIGVQFAMLQALGVGASG